MDIDFELDDLVGFGTAEDFGLAIAEEDMKGRTCASYYEIQSLCNRF
jgi:hypothetical protein